MMLNELHGKNGAIMVERNGVRVPETYGDPEEEYWSARKNILMTDYSHMGIASISGESAWELVNKLVAGDVSSIRNEQSMYTVILDDDGKIITDVYILCDDERYLLMSEWIAGEDLCDMLQTLADEYKNAFEDTPAIEALSPDFGVLHIEGPYSWELLSEVYGMDIIGLPFQEHMHTDEMLLLRAGKHGEFSYKLIGEQSQLVAAWRDLQQAGEKYRLRVGGLAYQRQVRLENPCWEPHVFNAFTRCPVELQMQWTVRYDKEQFAGDRAVALRAEQGVEKRVVGFILTQDKVNRTPAPGDKVVLEGNEIGEIITCGFSPALNQYIGRACLKEEYAQAEIAGYAIAVDGDFIEIKTAGVPFVHNFSFFVNPSEHSYVDPSRPSSVLEKSNG